MTERTVIPTCPTCGRDLDAVDTTGRSTTPPYLCSPCVRGWWPAELEPEARDAWDPITRSHVGPYAAVLEEKLVEDVLAQSDEDEGV